MIIKCPVSIGEIVDKLTILAIKEQKIATPSKLSHIKKEKALLEEILKEHKLEVATEYREQLYQINLKLWQIEEDLRQHEKRSDFGPQFIELARLVYKTNDQRFLVKDKINKMLGADVCEVKSY